MTTQMLSPLQDAFRHAMSAVCSPVSVVTALDGDSPYGTTVSAFNSLSMTPPMVLISLDRGSSLLGVLGSSPAFGLNVLSAEQDDLARRFASKLGPDKFTGVDWSMVAGVPALPGTIGFVACRVAQFVDAGDHILVLGEVEVAEHADVAPLTYHQRTFGTHARLG